MFLILPNVLFQTVLKLVLPQSVKLSLALMTKTNKSFAPHKTFLAMITMLAPPILATSILDAFTHSFLAKPATNAPKTLTALLGQLS
jgi:ABC-type polysaccharide transport system permease subunit